MVGTSDMVLFIYARKYRPALQKEKKVAIMISYRFLRGTMVYLPDDFCSVLVNDEGLVTLRGCKNRSIRKRYRETRVEMTEERVAVRYSGPRGSG